MGSPRPLDKRFTGNVILVTSADATHSFPPKNNLTSKIAYVDPSSGNFELASPKWLQTTDGKIAGIDFASLSEATKSEAAGKVISRFNSAPMGPLPQAAGDRPCDACEPDSVGQLTAERGQGDPSN
jgi:hypothetical protein